MHIGPNIVNNGLLFGYDTGYGSTLNNNIHSRFFRGRPTTNLLTGIGYSFGTQDTAAFKTNYGTETNFVPTLGERTTHFVNIFNTGANTCCPSPFSFGNFSVSPSTVYTYQIIFRTNNGYSHPNYMYQYQYNGGSFVTEFGLLDGGRIEDLGDGWRHGWGTFTTNASTNNISTFLFHYEYNFFNKIEIAGVSLTFGNTVLRPNQIPGVGQTRSSFVSLLDVTKQRFVDTSNVTFNTVGRMVFDGTDDFINLPINFQSGLTSASYEFICRSTSLPSGNYRQLYIQEASTWIALYNFGGVTFFGIDLNNGSGWFDNNGGFNTGARTTSNILVNTFYHIMFSWGNGVVRVYLNGVLQSTTSTLQSANGRQNVTSLGPGTTSRNIGSRFSGSANNWIGDMDVVRFYNRELSQQEVTRNFESYRNRFDI
jgi:hypothetical protein